MSLSNLNLKHLALSLLFPALLLGVSGCAKKSSNQINFRGIPLEINSDGQMKLIKQDNSSDHYSYTYKKIPLIGNDVQEQFDIKSGDVIEDCNRNMARFCIIENVKEHNVKSKPAIATGRDSKIRDNFNSYSSNGLYIIWPKD